MSKRCKLFYVMLCLAGLLALAGCQNKVSAETVAKEAAAAYQSKSSVVLQNAVNITGELVDEDQENIKMAIEMQIKTEMTKEPAASHSQANYNMNYNDEEFSYDTATYLVPEDGKTNSYVYFGDQWSRMENVSDTPKMHESVLTKLSELGEGLTLDDKTQQVNGTEVYVLHAEVPAETVQELVDLGSMLWGLVTESDHISETVSVTLYVAKNGYQPIQLDVDMSAYGQALLNSTGVWSEAALEYYCKMTFESFDTVNSIIVPEDVKAACESQEPGSDETGDVDGTDETYDFGSAAKNEDGSYTIRPDDTDTSATIHMAEGFEFYGSSSDTLTIGRNEQEFISYGYNPFYKEAEMEDYYHSILNYINEEKENFTDVEFSETQQMMIGEKTYKYFTVKYTSTADGMACLDYYSWTDDNGAVFACEIYGLSTTEVTLLKTALEAVEFK